MVPAVFLALAALCLSGCHADVSVSDYIYWEKANIAAWHQFFPSRGLEEERVTNLAANAAVISLDSGISTSLANIVTFQAQELKTAQELMAGTDAEGCVNGISDYITNAINKAIATYNDCTADAANKLSRLNISLVKLNNTYQNAFQRAMTGIDMCAGTYTNQDSISRLQSCVQAMTRNYYAAANATQAAVFPSPSMNYFTQVVVGCVSEASQSVAAKGAQFLTLLKDCAALDPSIDPTIYQEELSQWQGYNDTLPIQITVAQNKNYYQVMAVETDMINYYNLQKQALETYVIDSRGLQFYMNKMYAYLSDYYNTVTATSVDNPGDGSCTDAAKAALDAVASASAASSLSCDLEIVTNTKQLISEVNTTFTYLNQQMPVIGNAALLNCFARGYVFAKNTISNCFNLVYSGFDVDHNDRQAVILKDVNLLTGYEKSFFSGSDFPCDTLKGVSSLKRAYLGADTALYNLQRCLYIATGTSYSVTTPPTVANNTTPVS